MRFRRRDALGYLMAGGMGAAGALVGRGFAAAAEPIAGRTRPKFKLSLAAYSYRTQLSPRGDRPAEMTLFDFIDECAAMQLEGTELTGYYMPETPGPGYLHQLRAHAFRQGIAVSGTAIRCDFGFPEGSEQRAAELEHVRRWVDVAAELHAPMIRIFAGHPKPGIDDETTHRLIVDGITASCRYAGTRGIYLGLENHGGPTSTADGLLRIVRDVDSPWLGVNLDTGNFRGPDPYGQIAAAAPYSINVQVKVEMTDGQGKKVETDFARLADILRQANYRGFVVLEYEEGGDVPAQCRRYIQVLRESLSS